MHEDTPLTANADVDIKKNKRSRDEKLKRFQEIGGPKGLEPTRYGDWERNGRCIDF